MFKELFRSLKLSNFKKYCKLYILLNDTLERKIFDRLRLWDTLRCQPVWPRQPPLESKPFSRSERRKYNEFKILDTIRRSNFFNFWMFSFITWNRRLESINLWWCCNTRFDKIILFLIYPHCQMMAIFKLYFIIFKERIVRKYIQISWKINKLYMNRKLLLSKRNIYNSRLMYIKSCVYRSF